ncbi:MAG: hypothetical protein AAB659_00010 [Patescibacteria group bacterium]
MKKILIITFAMPLVFAFSINESKAESFLGAGFAIYNDPTFGYQESQYAPSTLRVQFWSYSKDSSAPTNFKFDCNGDGTFDVTQTNVSSVGTAYPPAEYKNKGGKWYTISAGDIPPYGKFVIPSSPWLAWWAESYGTQGIKCYYPKDGDYTLKMVAERGGVEASVSQSFTLRPPSVQIEVRPFSGGYGSVYVGKIPVAPADIDLGVAIYNPITYWSSPTSHWPLSTGPSATLKIDCESDGKYEETVGYSTTSNAGENWELWCNFFRSSSCYGNVASSLNWYSKACRYDKPGIYKATIKAELPTGAAPYIREVSTTEFMVLPGSLKDATVSFNTGGDTTNGQAPLNGVDLKLDVSGVFWAHTTYNFSCGNGQVVSKSINADFSKKDFNQDYSYTVKDFCNYTNPGEYFAKAQLEFRAVKLPGGADNVLPFKEISKTSTYTIYAVNKEIQILVTGKASDGEYVVTSPFDLRWDASRVNSCSVAGVGNSFYGIGIAAGSLNIKSVPSGDYSYKLNCLAGSGATVEKIIKVKVIGP